MREWWHPRSVKKHWPSDYSEARGEHAFLLKCEGLTLEEIGRRLGICREQARNKIRKFVEIHNREARLRRLARYAKREAKQ